MVRFKIQKKDRGVVGVAVSVVAVVFALMLWQEYEFEKMTPAQHLNKAKEGLSGDLYGIARARRHIAAIPAESSVRAEANQVERQLSDREHTLMEAQKEGVARQQQDATRNSSIIQLQADLKALGYDLKVTQSDPSEIAITSAEFDDTDHRVRFLSFIRGKSSPTWGACLAGFTMVRLKSSNVPILGFNEAYSLDCHAPEF